MDMGASMKREYAAAVRKTKPLSKQQPAISKGSKRARDVEEPVVSSAKKVKVSVQVEDVTIIVDHSITNSAKKSAARVKATPASRLAKKSTAPTALASSARRTPTNLRAADPGSSQSAHRQLPGTPSAKSIPRGRTKQTARKSVVGFGGPPSSQHSTIKPEPRYEDSDYDHFVSPSATSSSYIKPESTHHYVPAPPQTNITGVYNIVSPHIADQDSKLRLLLQVDNESDKIWGSFELGWQGGTIKIDHIATDRPVSFRMARQGLWEAGESEVWKRVFWRD